MKIDSQQIKKVYFFSNFVSAHMSQTNMDEYLSIIRDITKIPYGCCKNS
jgi:hypothetical protein